MQLVITELRGDALNRASWEAIAAAQQLGGPIKIVVAGHDVSKAAAELAAADAAEVIAIEHDALTLYTPDAFVQALAPIVQAESPAHVVFAHTYQTRDYAPRLAARLDRALITDCVAVKAHGGQPAFVRPMFQGKVAADVVAEGPAPHFVTFQIGAFRADAAKRGSAAATVRKIT